MVLISGAHPELYRRGAEHVRGGADAFTARLLTRTGPERAIRAAFATLFATLVVRTAYGPAFTGPELDDETLIAELSTMVSRHLAGG